MRNRLLALGGAVRIRRVDEWWRLRGRRGRTGRGDRSAPDGLRADFDRAVLGAQTSREPWWPTRRHALIGASFGGRRSAEQWEAWAAVPARGVGGVGEAVFTRVLGGGGAVRDGELPEDVAQVELHHWSVIQSLWQIPCRTVRSLGPPDGPVRVGQLGAVVVGGELAPIKAGRGRRCAEPLAQHGGGIERVDRLEHVGLRSLAQPPSRPDVPTRRRHRAR
jgi:hypothetical protein